MELWWDRSVKTTQKMKHNYPGVAVFDGVTWGWTFVNFSVAWDKNVRCKNG